MRTMLPLRRPLAQFATLAITAMLMAAPAHAAKSKSSSVKSKPTATKTTSSKTTRPSQTSYKCTINGKQVTQRSPCPDNKK